MSTSTTFSDPDLVEITDEAEARATGQGPARGGGQGEDIGDRAFELPVEVVAVRVGAQPSVAARRHPLR